MAPLFWWLIFGVAYPAFSLVTSIVLWKIEYENWPRDKKYPGALSVQAAWAIFGTALFPLFGWLAFLTMRLLRNVERRAIINAAVEKGIQKRWDEIKHKSALLEDELGIHKDD